MVRDALATHYNVSLLASLDLEFRALYLNVYFARTALPEPARNALDCRTFPFFSNKIFALSLGEFLYELAEGMCSLPLVSSDTRARWQEIPNLTGTLGLIIHGSLGNGRNTYQGPKGMPQEIP